MWFNKKAISSIEYVLPRSELLRRSRILVVDDERPALIDDLAASHFAVDYQPDITKESINLVDNSVYDLIILDYGGVGKSFGNDQGLSLLRHIRRVNPAVVVLAYTSKALKAHQGDFFRLADGILAKDAGISDSLAKIEDGLRKAHSIDNVWSGILTLANTAPGSKEDIAWQDMFVRGLNKANSRKQLKELLATAFGSEASKAVGMILLEKAIELGIKATIGG
jgi:DNA-binding response OmpR family regulator